jgi:hypothetical protein
MIAITTVHVLILTVHSIVLAIMATQETGLIVKVGFRILAYCDFIDIWFIII